MGAEFAAIIAAQDTVTGRQKHDIASPEVCSQPRQELWRLHKHLGRARPPGRGQRQSLEYALRMVTLHLLDNWPRLTLCQQADEPYLDNLGRRQRWGYALPSTSNATENGIGRAGKLRAKQTRGFRREDTIIPILTLLASLGGLLAGVAFEALVS